MHHRFHGLACALATVTLGLPLPAAAQTPADPADRKAPTPALGYRSAFADYKPYQDIEPGDWRRLNASVGAAALKPSGAASGETRQAPMPSPQDRQPHPQGGAR